MPELPLNCHSSKQGPVSVCLMSSFWVPTREIHGGAVWSKSCLPLQDLGVSDPNFPSLDPEIYSWWDPMQQNEGDLTAFDNAATMEELLGPREEAFQGEFPFQSASIPIFRSSTQPHFGSISCTRASICLPEIWSKTHTKYKGKLWSVDATLCTCSTFLSFKCSEFSGGLKR